MRNWHDHIKRHLLIWSAVALFGFLIGQLLWALLILAIIYTLRNYYQLHRFTLWLNSDQRKQPSEPPESYGIWGDIYDGIYRLQKQERSSSAHLENIINKAQESSAALEMAVIMINQHDNLDWWNKAAEKLLGFKFPQDKNQSINNLIRNPKFHDYFYNENYAEALVMEAPGDANKVLEFQIALFGEHERLMIVRDITQLQRLARMRKDFVANVSHELGTPITVIKGYLEAIIDNQDSLDKKWHKPMQQMRQQSMRMENIVRDLLLLSSLETKTPPRNRQEINTTALVREIENDTRQMFTDKSHTIRIDCASDAVISGKRNELYSAVSNLVVNAAKYTPANGEITVRTYFTDESFIIAVSDNGIGIEAHHIPRLTERFYRVDVSRSSDSGGTGLGLAIVKHILARHDAELVIESQYGKGSEFRCEFPLARVSKVDQAIAADNQSAETAAAR
ncbi:MAG: phosphate regulon sensor histidine kinase PhoR [Gammaproteobacteria bacterium]